MLGCRKTDICFPAFERRRPEDILRRLNKERKECCCGMTCLTACVQMQGEIL